MSSQLELTNHHWAPYSPMQQVVRSIASSSKLIVEIGPGYIPFSLATEFIDWQVSPSLAGKRVHCLDINTDPLPYEDKSVDFIYCRHTLEDLYNPFWVCREMSRVAKAGYIETPSPVAEWCRRVDGGSPHWRGYIILNFYSTIQIFNVRLIIMRRWLKHCKFLAKVTCKLLVNMVLLFNLKYAASTIYRSHL